MANDHRNIILEAGVSFTKWKSGLQAKLARRNVLGHVFHDIPGIRPILIPTNPLADDLSNPSTEHENKLGQWILGEIEAKNIIINRLSSSTCPQNYDNMKAKELYDAVASTRQETAIAPYAIALENFLLVKFLTTADDYIDRFLAGYQSVNNAADALPSHTVPKRSGYHVGDGQAAAIFVMGTRRIDWLNIWRDTYVYEPNNEYVSLQTMMSSLRSVAGNRSLPAQVAHASSLPTTRNLDPNAICKRCRHRHKNRERFKLHPELAPNQVRGSITNKNNGNSATAKYDNDDSDEDSEGGLIIAATSSLNEYRSIYDIGASHHFVPSKSSFAFINKTNKPFRFDQAVGASTLNSLGTAHIKIGSLTLELHDALFSPNSSCNIISAGRLERISGILPDYKNMLLVRQLPKENDQPVAKLICQNDVFYIHPFDHSKSTSPIVAAPGVARVPTTTSAQRWHQRLGHTGQTILKKTAQVSKGLEGVDLSELSTCETCHLSKAQRFVSREPRPIPNQPLDEIHVDTVGIISPAINGHQYVVIITDAITKMRWSITTETKDQIAPLLIKWVCCRIN